MPAGGRRVSSAVLDREHATATDIAALNALCVVDAAGPFQAQNLRFARAVIDARCHYVDLADARDFVSAFPTLDAVAKARGVLAVTGASTTPALTHAVLDDLTRGWTRVDGVEVGISPGGGTSFGLAVIQAILSYVGKPVRVWRHGRWDTAPGWSLNVRRAVGEAGKRWLSLCDTPDLDLIPQRFPSVRRAVFRAGLELSVLHWALWALGFLVRFGLMQSLRPLAEPLRDAAAFARRFGSDTGGMLVEVSGVYGDGSQLKTIWSLTADAGDGPEIPTFGALCIVRGLLDGRLTQTGATACVGMLDIAAFEREFKRFDIRSARETTRLEARSLFEHALEGFQRMPTNVRAAHMPDPACELQGRVDIDGAAHPIGHAIARMFGFPASAREEAAFVTIEREEDGETWIRRFGPAVFMSRLQAARTTNRLVERFGVLAFDLGARADETGFELSIAGARLWGVPLPSALVPATLARASTDEQGRYCFDVTITLPFLGRLVRYRGWLEPRRLR